MTYGQRTEGKRMKALEELVRELVKFTAHDPACAELKEPEPDLDGVQHKATCTCGIRRLYEKIDELIE